MSAPGTKRTFYSDLLDPRPRSICKKTFENSGEFPFGITKAMVLEPATFLRIVTEAMPSESIVTSTLLVREVRFVPKMDTRNKIPSLKKGAGDGIVKPGQVELSWLLLNICTQKNV